MTYYDKYVLSMNYFLTEWNNTPIYMVNTDKSAKDVLEFVTLDCGGQHEELCITSKIPNTNLSMKVAFYSDYSGKVEKMRSDFQIQFSGQRVDVATTLTISPIKISNPILRLQDDLYEGYLYFRIKDD